MKNNHTSHIWVNFHIQHQGCSFSQTNASVRTTRKAGYMERKVLSEGARALLKHLGLKGPSSWRKASLLNFCQGWVRKRGSKISEKSTMEAGKESMVPFWPSLPLKDHPEVEQFTQASGWVPQMDKSLATAISGGNTHMTLLSPSPASLPLSSFLLPGMVIPNKATAHEPSAWSFAQYWN